jgi:protein SCO1/2
MPTRRQLITGATSERPLPARKPASRYGEAYFSNVTLVTHAGARVRFYDDLIRGRTVAFNMMYATCSGICPVATSNLLHVQQLLGARAGTHVHMYSITLLPEHDTTYVLREYVRSHGIGPGWQFLTGAADDIRRVRYRLGFFDPDPEVDADRSTHTGMVRIGNDVSQRWIMAASLAAPEQIIASIDHVDPAVARPGRGMGVSPAN